MKKPILSYEGHVKIYRPPFCDHCAEWTEVCVVEMVYNVSLRNYEYLFINIVHLCKLCYIL